MPTYRVPVLCLAYVCSSLSVLLPTPSSGLRVLAGHYPDYSSTTSWSDCHAAILPPHLFGFVGSFDWERHGSPKFRCKPLNDLPWTQTPARRDTLTMTRVTILASRANNLWPFCDDGYFGAQYLHLRYGRPFAIRMASCTTLSRRQAMPNCRSLAHGDPRGQYRRGSKRGR